MTPLTRTELRLLAVRRMARGQHLQRLHQRDGVGCCRSCGRVHPCDGHRLGAALVRYYRHFAATDGQAAQSRTAESPVYLVRIRGLHRWWVRHEPG